MNDSLFSENEIPASVPKWKQLTDQHGIQTWHNPSGFLEGDKLVMDKDENGNDTEPFQYRALCVSSGSRPYWGHSKRQAAVTALHTLKLDGWETVSVEP